jgi:diguanylate cyclase (GGDEF)-like protein
MRLTNFKAGDRWRACLLMLALWLACTCGASATELSIQVLATPAAEPAAVASSPDASGAGVAPRQMQAGRRSVAATTAEPQVVLQILPSDGIWPAPPQVLQVKNSGLQWLSLERGGEAGARVRALNPQPGVNHGHGDVAFLLRELPPNGQPLRLHVDARGVLASPMAVRLLEADAYAAQDAKWLSFASAMLAVMLAMAVMALVFAFYLRDPTFLWYSGYLLAYVWILGMQTGFAARPLGIEFVTGTPVSGRIATVAAVGFAALFLDRFAFLSRYAPRLRMTLFVLAAAVSAATLLSLSPLEPLRAIGRGLTNPLLILGGPLLLITALWAGLRGSRYGWIFAMGWAPLLAATVMGSLQLFGFFADWLWLDAAALAAGAFEALVLSVGVAHRSLELRRDRDLARRLADIDPLTGLLNRRAWTEQVERSVLARPSAPLSVLFIDVDHFKVLNDSQGHEAGDRALSRMADLLGSELRGQDLLARHGGEELVAALPGCTATDAEEIAERLRRRVEREFAGAGTGGSAGLTISIGVAERSPSEALPDVVRRADAAMYAAKSAGRNRVQRAQAQAAVV